MKKIKSSCIAMALAAAQTVMAGGLLTNTNQNISFLRNPARDAAIGIDGVYSNPAGVIFLGDGFHLSLNIQNAHQTRTVSSWSELYKLGMNNNGSDFKEFKGEADAPIIPSIQAAYNKGKWSYQFGFAVTGGGGKCTFDYGIPTFESSIALIATQLNAFGAKGYDMNAFMEGRQYYYGFTAGAAYKLNKNLSVYGGLRLLYGSASYKAKVSDIKVNTDNGAVPFDKFLDAANQTVVGGISQVQQAIGLYESAGIPVPEEYTAQLTTLKTAEGSLNMLEPYRDGVNLMCDQTAWGMAPIIGIDYKAGKLNLAAKYEFKTRMKMKNKSTVKETSLISAVNKFKDGEKVDEDSPALLTVGAQYEILPSLRVMAGWHHYFDVDTKQYTKEMLSDSNEYLFGAEYDICKKLQVSAGMQRTAYDFKDAGMNDLSFNVSSYSYGLGIGYNVTDKVKINAAWFQTLYDDYDKAPDAMGVKNSFTRTNRVIGVGVDLKF
ncbi:MAG: OmpP1/FadL family transporter [Prevotella sp.]